MKLFRRHDKTHPDLASALERLDRLAEDTPQLRDAVALQGAILRAVYADPPQAGALDLPRERAAEKIRSGVPLLRGEPVPLDVPAVERLMLRLCGVMRERGRTPGAAEEIAAAIRGRALSVVELVGAVLDGKAADIRAVAAELGLDGDMLCTLLRFSLFPSLAQLAADVAPLRTATWQQGYCPTCGSWPLLGEHHGLDQTRFLRCGLCATAWAMDRLLCPFCGSRDHQDLGYLHVEGQDQKRAVTCESCRGYVKVLASLTPIPPLELVVQDLATLHLDMVALERGYAAPL
jgi:FdhE protein